MCTVRLLRRRTCLVALLASWIGIAANAGASPIAITTQSDLAFGGVVAGGAAGTVSVSTAGSRSAGGGVALASPAGVSPAAFRVTGEPLLSFGIVLPPSATLDSGSSSMTVDGFASSPSGSGALGLDGQATVQLGATLHVGSGQPTGVYLGSFELTVAYE